jgi:hypothetical protein
MSTTDTLEAIPVGQVKPGKIGTYATYWDRLLDVTLPPGSVLNGSILGMKRAEIVRKFDEIVAFSEVDRFLDTLVKRYSSGMYIRPGFAGAAHLDPEILVVDEVLAVGEVPPLPWA